MAFAVGLFCAVEVADNLIPWVQNLNESHKAQIAAQRDTEQTLMKTFKQRETGRRKSVNNMMSRVNLRRTQMGSLAGSPGRRPVQSVSYFSVSTMSAVWFLKL